MAKYINADELISVLNKLTNLYLENPHIVCGLEMAKSAVKEMPTKCGEWVEDWTPIGEHRTYTCSCNVCGWDEGCQRDFCPNCGAYMKGDKDEVQG